VSGFRSCHHHVTRRIVNWFEGLGIVDIVFGRWMRGIMVAVLMSLSIAQVAAKEILFVYPPDGWRLSFETKTDNLHFFEYFPKGETPQQWTEMVTIQIVGNLNRISASVLADNLRTRFVTGCARQTLRGPERFNLEGYLAIRLYVECDKPTFKRRPGGSGFLQHEVAAFQIIQGQRDLYIIERAWHGRSRSSPNSPYERDHLWGWDAFWHSIEVCDTEEQSRACFGLGLLSPEKATIFASQANPVLPYGCDYFRVLSLLPDTARATRPTRVVPLKLRLGRFGDLKPDRRLIDDLLAAYEENRPVAVIVTMAGSASSDIFPIDAAKAARDTNAIASLLVAGGVATDRVHQALNADCPGG
jgi:hypothetical protein